MNPLKLKHTLRYGLIAALFLIMNSVAFEYPMAPEKSFFSFALWRDRHVITVGPDGLELTEDTLIKVDELVLNGPLYSNGFSLKVDALQITFGENGSIRGFKNAAPNGVTAPKGGDGPASPSAEGTGGNGFAPPTAPNGVDGHQQPAAIVVYAARMSGTVKIDGTGQSGGRGGFGGIGGKGGRGGPGRKGSASCWAWVGARESDGTQGGRGGQGGPGGKGGDGGRGGAPIPVIVSAGEQIPQSAQIISKKGSVGKFGEPGAPGDPGDGGAGGLGDSVGCGFWPGEWSSSVSGGPVGPRGPIQTATNGPGRDGLEAPDVDSQTEPLPTFAALADPDRPGVIQTQLPTLEDLRFRLVNTWSEFHWARQFLFLTLDTLNELRVRDTNRDGSIGTSEMIAGSDIDGLLKTLVNDTEKVRIQNLIGLWQTTFVQPVESQPVNMTAPLQGADQRGRDVVDLLEQLAKEPLDAVAIRAQLERLRGGVQAQFQATLQVALDSCLKYNQEKLKVLPVVLNLTSQYSVPVCEGEPDFSQIENVDKTIYLFRKPTQIVPAILNPFYRVIALQEPQQQEQQQQWPRLIPVLFPMAWAEGFSVNSVENLDSAIADIRNRLPARRQWQISGLGVFMGFPDIQRSRSTLELGQNIFYLQQYLTRIRSR